MTDVRIRRASLLSILSPGQNASVGHLWRAARRNPFQVGRQEVGSNINMAMGSVSRLLGILRGVGLLAITKPGSRLRSTSGGSRPPVRVLTFEYDRPDLLVSQPTYLALVEAMKARRQGKPKNVTLIMAREVFSLENQVDIDRRLLVALSQIGTQNSVITINAIPEATHGSGITFDRLGLPGMIRCLGKAIKTEVPNMSSEHTPTPPVRDSVRSAQLHSNSLLLISKKRTTDSQAAPRPEAAPRGNTSDSSGEDPRAVDTLSKVCGRLAEEPDQVSGEEASPEPLDNRGAILRRQSDGTLTMGCIPNKPDIPDWVWSSLPPYPAGENWPQRITPHPPKLSDGDDVTPEDLLVCETAYRAAWKLLTGEMLPSQWNPLKPTNKKGGKNPNLTKIGNCVKLLKKHDIRYPHLWAEFRLRQLYFRDGGTPRSGCPKRTRNFVSAFSSKGVQNEISREIFKNSRVQDRAAWMAAPTYAQTRAIIRWERLKSLVVSSPPKDPDLMTEVLSEHWPSKAIDRMRAAAVSEASGFDQEIRVRIKTGDWVWL